MLKRNGKGFWSTDPAGSWKTDERVKMAVICNEFTPATATDPFPLSHCHAYVVTKEKMLFSKVKTYFRQRLHTRIADRERPLNFRETARYVTKHDRQAVVLNVPLKNTTTSWRAAVYAQHHTVVNWGGCHSIHHSPLWPESIPGGCGGWK